MKYHDLIKFMEDNLNVPFLTSQILLYNNVGQNTFVQLRDLAWEGTINRKEVKVRL